MARKKSVKAREESACKATLEPTTGNPCLDPEGNSYPQHECRYVEGECQRFHRCKHCGLKWAVEQRYSTKTLKRL